MLVTLLIPVPLVVYYGGEWRGAEWWFGREVGTSAPIYQDGWPSPVGIFLGFAFAALLGRLLRSAWIDHAAQRTAELLATRWQMLQARREHALAEERQRIAGEVHDTLAHSLTVVLAQAEGALRADEVERTASLGNIATVSRSALRDVRALIERLDVGAPGTGFGRLSELDMLVDSVRSAGLDVETSQQGTAVELGDAAELAAYRIVQESLTNALKHGDTEQPVWLILEWSQDERAVLIRVVSGLRRDPEDTPPPRKRTDAALEGRGLEGMRLRAERIGGWCTAGAQDDTWTIEALIPAGASS